MNQITLLGRIGKKPELKQLENGNSLCNFSVATNRSWKSKDGEKQTETTWHSCTCFGKTAEVIAEWFDTGSEILVQGRINNRSWETPDGDVKYRTDVIIENFEFTGGSKSEPKTNKKSISEEAKEIF